MKKKDYTVFPLILMGSTLVLLGAAAYLYLSARIEDDDINFDLWDEDISNYA